MKKEPTEKQLAARKKLGEAAKARAAAKRAQKELDRRHADGGVENGFAFEEKTSDVVLPDVPTEEEPVPAPAPTQQPGMTLTNEQFEMLLNRFAGMAKEEPKTPKVGIIERYPVDAKNYRNPVEELMDLPSLRRFGMRENFAIDWAVKLAKYETSQGQWFLEPRFEITLKRKQFDPETNEEIVRHDKNGKPFHPRIVLGRASFFVDPPADLIEAELAGLDDADLTDAELQDRMFFWRYSMWLEERISPKKPNFTTNAMKEEVIGGKAYQIEEYSMPI